MFATAGDAGFSIPCPTVAQGSVITLRADMFIGNPIPGNVFIDLIQNESVAASQKFPYTTGTRMLVVSAGQYTLGLRMNDNYNLSIIEFYFQPSSGSGFFAKPGDTITIQDGLSYDITVTNSMIP